MRGEGSSLIAVICSCWKHDAVREFLERGTALRKGEGYD